MLPSELIQWGLGNPVIERCLFCDWELHGTVEECAKAHAHHALEAHQISRKPRRHRSRKPFTKHAFLDDNIANARAKGASTWAGPIGDTEFRSGETADAPMGRHAEAARGDFSSRRRRAGTDSPQ